MSIVLPGERVPAQHINLKLVPGLLLSSNPSDSRLIISTRAGTFNHSANGSKWWIESNSRRVRSNPSRYQFTGSNCSNFSTAQKTVIGSVAQKQGEGFRIDIGQHIL